MFSSAPSGVVFYPFPQTELPSRSVSMYLKKIGLPQQTEAHRPSPPNPFPPCCATVLAQCLSPRVFTPMSGWMRFTDAFAIRSPTAAAIPQQRRAPAIMLATPKPTRPPSELETPGKAASLHGLQAFQGLLHPNPRGPGVPSQAAGLIEDRWSGSCFGDCILVRRGQWFPIRMILLGCRPVPTVMSSVPRHTIASELDLPCSWGSDGPLGRACGPSEARV